MRRVLVVASDLRGCRVSGFDGARQRWIVLAETDDATDDAFWQVAVDTVAKAEPVR